MNISRLNRNRFCTAAIEYISERGGIVKKTEDTRTEFLIPTSIGELWIAVLNEPSSLHFVATNFIGNEEAAKAKFGHWKQNYISSEDYLDTHDNILAFKSHLSKLL